MTVIYTLITERGNGNLSKFTKNEEFTMIKFDDIKTKKQLKTRIDKGVLSVGCYWTTIRSFFSEKPGRGLKAVKIKYTASPGVHTIIRYI